MTASANLGESRACTSIVAQPAGGAAPVHGRNLDYPIKEAMLPITVVVDWQRGGATQFESVGYFGTVGFNTALRPGAWSLSHDERDQGPIGENWADLFLRRRVATFSQIRLAADGAATYADAVARFRAIALAAPSYFILAGARPGEGALLTRGRDAAGSDLEVLNATSGRWYVLETNYDHWAPPGAHDDRRHPAEAALAAVGAAAVSVPTMLGVLSDTRCNATAGERSVLNSMTTYTAVMSPGASGGTGRMRVVLRTTDGGARAKCDKW